MHFPLVEYTITIQVKMNGVNYMRWVPRDYLNCRDAIQREIIEVVIHENGAIISDEMVGKGGR